MKTARLLEVQSLDREDSMNGGLRMQRPIVPRRAMRFISSALLALTPLFPHFRWAQAQPTANKPIVFLIVIENKKRGGYGAGLRKRGSSLYQQDAVSHAAVANNYFNPPGNHPSLPNYLWMEAGRNFGIHDDGPPSQHHQSTHASSDHAFEECRSSPGAPYAESHLWECLPTDFGKWRAVSNEATFHLFTSLT